MKNKSAILMVLLAGLLLTISFSCKKGSHEPTYKEPVYVKNDSINQNVFNINSNEATLKSDSAKLSQGIYELQFSGTPLKFKAGDIIVSQDNQGYLRKVISETISGNTVTLQTSQATLEDLYKDAQISFQLNLGGKKVANLNSAVLRETKVNYIQKGMKLQGNGLSFDFSNTTIYQSGPLTFKISQGNVTFEPNFIFDIDISHFKVKKIAFYADNADLNINCDVNLNASQKIQLANFTKNLADIDSYYTVWVYMVPVVVVVNTKLMARLTADVNSELNVSTGFINNYKISLGAIYDNSIWTGKYGLTPTFTPKPVDISGSVQFAQSLTITPEVSVRLYGVAGPYCTPEMYEQFNANVASPSLDWDALLKVGVNTTVGADVTIFGETLAGYSKTYNAEKELWNAPYSITKISGDNQSGTANHALAQPLKIKVTDNLNNALKNVVIYFNVAQGGGSVNPSSIKTDVNGFAETIWTLGGGTINEVQVKVKKSDGTDISSSPLSFTSLFLVPNLTTTALTNITQTTAKSGGNITSDGGAPVTARGVCWSTSQTPTTANNKTTDGSGAGSFTSSIIGLTANTTYYVRAYAINSVNTAYGNQVTFTTGQTTTLPTVTTNSVTSITQTSASSGGNVTSDGGASVTARGVCWSTTQTPTTSNFKTTNGSGINTFTSSLTGLTANTTYYVRAYATNSVNTAYGNQVSFTTGQTTTLPTVTTNSITSITQTTASSGGNVTADGGATVTARGVCWSNTQTPTTSNFKTTDGSGINTFTSNLTGLTSNTTYYVRAYATNSAGTAYGNQVSFLTTNSIVYGSVTDIDGNVYKTVTIGTQVWMAENLKTTKYRNGESIPNVTVDATWGALTTGAFCWYNNDAANNKAAYGALYNWYSVADSRNIAPTGWHVATDGEWHVLNLYLGGDIVSGGKLKETGTAHWLGSNTGATNSTGFTALPGGNRNSIGSWGDLGFWGYWWSSTSHDSYFEISSFAWDISLTNGNAAFFSDYYSDKCFGLSVRCVRD